MQWVGIDDLMEEQNCYTSLLYCPPGGGKSTAIGLIAEASEGSTLVLDIDRTVTKTLAKREIVKDISRIQVQQIDNLHTFDDWTKILTELVALKEAGKLPFKTIAVDNISELERCILSDLGSKGKNKGVPAQADYQYMQFKLVNSLRYLKSLNVNIVLTAWETTGNFTMPDGTSYNRRYPKTSEKILDNICGLCDIVGNIVINKEGKRGIMLEGTQNIYAKNQIDSRKWCYVEDFTKFEK